MTKMSSCTFFVRMLCEDEGCSSEEEDDKAVITIDEDEGDTQKETKRERVYLLMLTMMTTIWMKSPPWTITVETEMTARHRVRPQVLWMPLSCAV
jgi:hypothetical protein